MASLEVGVLGPLRVTVAGQPISLGPRQRELLAALVCEPGRMVPGPRLAELIWGYPPPERSLVTLRSHISHLRRALLPIRTHGTAAGAGYALDIAPEQLDAYRFDQLVQSGRQLIGDGDWTRALEHLDGALALWRGPAFTEVADRPFARAEIGRLEALRHTAVVARAETLVSLGRAGEVTRELEALLAADPLAEPARILLAKALHASRRLAEAAQVCRDGLRLLHESGVDSPALQELQRRILRDEPSADEPPRGRGPNTLPAGAGVFAGREAELAALLAAVRPDAATVVTIDGMPGAGKTTLALHGARMIKARYPDGQLFIDLCGHSGDDAPLAPLAALAQLLRMLGVPADRLADDLPGRAAQWRAELAGRRVLLVLDNAATASQVRPLLTGEPGSLAIVTSRRRLSGSDGMLAVTVGGMTAAEALHLLRHSVGDARVDAEPAAAEQVVRLCGAVPLAVAIAGARLRHHPNWTLAHLAERLTGDPLPELVSEDRSMVRAFMLSYSRLDPTTRRVFALLGLLAVQDFAPPAVAAVTGLDLATAERALEDLVDMHLLDQPYPGRYRLHDLLRHYARRLGAREPDHIKNLLDYCLHTTTTAANILDPFRRQTPLAALAPRTDLPAPAAYDEAIKWLEAERAQLVATVELAAAHGFPAYAWRIARALGRFFNRRGYLDDWITTGEVALRAATTAGDRLGTAASSVYLATAYRHRGSYAKARRLLRRGFETYHELGDPHGEAEALEILGQVENHLGHSRRGLQRQKRAMELYRQSGDTNGQAHALNNLGAAHRYAGRLEEAMRCYREAAQLFRASVDRVGEGSALLNLGDALEQAGRCEEALVALRTALPLHRAGGDQRGEAYALNVLGNVHRQLGRWAESIDSHRAALDAMRRLSHRVAEIEVLNDLAETFLACGDRDAVLEHGELALRLAQQAQTPQPQGRAHHVIARALGTRDPAAAREHWQHAVKIFDELGLPDADNARRGLAEHEARWYAAGFADGAS